jgi:cysteinyl-tRNA synthetase
MLLLYNTLTRKKEELKPLNDNRLNLFVCGLTVYDDAHLGHAKAFINFDVIVRWLRYIGYTVKYVQNITDVDDKIIKRAGELGKDPIELARYYEDRFMEDLDALGAKKSVDEFPRSHDYIEAIRNQIQLLFDNGYAYYLDGDVYYDVSKFKNYTKLSGMKIDELEKHRIEPREGKKNVYDFALWKAAKAGEPSWKIKVKAKGKEIALDGRPGWHIEDTAMTYEIFGPQYDIHGGANELIFPHHTNEIAQAEAAFGKVPFVRYWMHCGVFSIKGEKMSKSLKNFITIREALKLHSAEAIRLLYSSTHYRKDMEYSEEAIQEAEKRLGYMYAALGVFYNMNNDVSHEKGSELNDLVNNLKKEFTDAMNDDFNTPLALSNLTIALNELRSYAENNSSVGEKTKGKVIKCVLELANTVGILEREIYKEPIPNEVVILLKKREELRKQKKFKESDEVRKQLKEKYHIVLEDTKEGVRWHRE